MYVCPTVVVFYMYVLPLEFESQQSCSQVCREWEDDCVVLVALNIIADESVFFYNETYLYLSSVPSELKRRRKQGLYNYIISYNYIWIWKNKIVHLFQCLWLCDSGLCIEFLLLMVNQAQGIFLPPWGEGGVGRHTCGNVMSHAVFTVPFK